MLIYFSAIQNRHYAQGFWQENKIKAEQFFYDQKKYDVVIVGTSMSEGISIAPGIENSTTLNFVGGAAITGLALIKDAKILPKVILIEMNWLERPVYKELLEQVTPKSIFKLKTMAPSFLEANQPANVLCNLFKIKPSYIDKDKEQSYFPYLLSQNFKSQNFPVDLAQLKMNIEASKKYVDYFLKKGVKIYLMEIPVDQKIYNAARCVEVRKEVTSIYSDVPIIPSFSGSATLKTSDGYHLTETSRKQYSSFLVAYLKNKK